MELNVKISFSQETLSVISSLAGALSGKSAISVQGVAAPKTVEQPIQTPAPVAQQPQYQPQPQPQPQQTFVPQQQQQVPQQQQPFAQPGQQPTGVPTTGQNYSMEQLAVAATQLVDAGRRNDLVNLLSSFGVQALTVLPKEQYGAFATQLRAMGAKI